MSDDNIPGLYDDRSAVGAQDVTAPVIVVANQTFTVGAAESYTPTITEAGSYTVALQSGSLPTGATLKPSTGEIAVTPTVVEAVSLRLRVVDGAGQSVISDEFTITVKLGFVTEFFEPFVADDVDWDEIVVPTIDFDTSETTFDESFETSSGWDP